MNSVLFLAASIFENWVFNWILIFIISSGIFWLVCRFVFRKNHWWFYLPTSLSLGVLTVLFFMAGFLSFKYFMPFF
jgi:hypothetical protein